MKGLYAIVDLQALDRAGLCPTEFARAVLDAPLAALQLRAKGVGAARTLAVLEAIRAIAAPLGIPLVANDRPDLAEMAGCDAVHLGQEDLPLSEARRWFPRLRVGISTHDLQQLRLALSHRPDYVAFGPVFPTRSKANPDPTVGLEALLEAQAACRAAGVPLVAIGGIDATRIAEVASVADCAAVISALVPGPGEPAPAAGARARRLALAFGAARGASRVG